MSAPPTIAPVKIKQRGAPRRSRRNALVCGALTISLIAVAGLSDQRLSQAAPVSFSLDGPARIDSPPDDPVQATRGEQTTVVTTPVADPPNPPTNPGAAFAADFTGNTGIDAFDFGLYHRDSTLVLRDEWPSDHDLSCGSPATQRTVHRDTNEWIYACKDHLMTSIGDTAGYSTAWFAPKTDFSGQRTVSWDVNVTDLGPRQWWEVMIVSSDFYSGVASCPQCAVHPDLSLSPAGLPTYPSGSIVVGNGPFGTDVRVHTQGRDRNVAQYTSVCSVDPEGCASKPIRRTFSITDNANGTITVQFGQVGRYTVPGSFPADFDVIIKDHSYTPEKDNNPIGFTWHWDNIVVR